MLVTAFLASLTFVATNVAGQYVDLSQNIGAPQNLASGIIYGEPLNDQIPAHYYTDVGLKYGRAGGAQLAAPNRGWSFGEYPGRFQATLKNYQQSRRFGGNFIILPHDIWGVDFRTDNYVWPGQNGNWTSYDNFLNQLISDVKKNNMLPGLVWDIWNEADGGFWNGNQSQWLELYSRTHKRIRSDPALNTVQISGPAHSGYPSFGNSWWTNWAQMVKDQNIIPDQYAWHHEGGGDPAQVANEFANLQSAFGLPQRLININEYATFNEMNAGGYAWYISRFERLGWTGLLGNWQNGALVYDNLANLITKTGNAQDTSNTAYTPATGYWVFQYYTQSMKGYRARSYGSGNGNCDVFPVVGQDKVRILTSCHYYDENYNIYVGGVGAVGLPQNGATEVTVFKFDSTNNAFDPISAPTNVGSFMMPINNGVGVMQVFPRDPKYAYTFEFANNKTTVISSSSSSSSASRSSSAASSSSVKSISTSASVSKTSSSVSSASRTSSVSQVISSSSSSTPSSTSSAKASSQSASSVSKSSSSAVKSTSSSMPSSSSSSKPNTSSSTPSSSSSSTSATSSKPAKRGRYMRE